MCEAAVAIVLVPAASHEFYRDFIMIHIVANLLERAVQEKRGDRVAHRHEPRLGEANRHAYHKLLT